MITAVHGLRVPLSLVTDTCSGCYIGMKTTSEDTTFLANGLVVFGYWAETL